MYNLEALSWNIATVDSRIKLSRAASIFSQLETICVLKRLLIFTFHPLTKVLSWQRIRVLLRLN